jgi:hypothetical protein
MEWSTALELGREQAEQYPEGPWPVLLAELDRRGTVIERVRELHPEVVWTEWADVRETACGACSQPGGRRVEWPCPTLLALDGEPSSADEHNLCPRCSCSVSRHDAGGCRYCGCSLPHGGS